MELLFDLGHLPTFHDHNLNFINRANRLTAIINWFQIVWQSHNCKVIGKPLLILRTFICFSFLLIIILGSVALIIFWSFRDLGARCAYALKSGTLGSCAFKASTLRCHPLILPLWKFIRTLRHNRSSSWTLHLSLNHAKQKCSELTGHSSYIFKII